MDLLSAALSESGLDGDFFTATTVAPTNVQTCAPTVVTTTAPTSSSNETTTPAPQPTAKQEEKPASPVLNLDEVDIFSQALMQLEETNKQAEVYEQQHKLSHPEDKPKPQPAQTVINQNHVQAIQTTRHLPTTTVQTLNTAPTVVTLPQQQFVTTTPRRSGSPVSLVAQLAAQPKRASSPLVLTNDQIQALQRSGSPITIMPSTPNTQGNMVVMPQSVVAQGGQAKKITVIKGGNTGVQQVITLPSGGVGLQQSVIGTPGQQIVNRQTVNTAGKKVHVVTLSPQVVQTPNGPRTVTIKKVQQAVVTNGSPTLVSGNLQSTPLSKVTTTPTAQRFTVTRTSDGQIRIIKPPGEFQSNQTAIVNNPQGLIRIQQPSSAVRSSPQPIVVSSSPAAQVVTPQRQQTVQPRYITMGSTPLSSRTISTQGIPASTTNVRTLTPTTSSNNGIINTKLSEKDVSRLWVNDDIKLKKLITPQPQVPVQMIGPGGIPAAVALDEAEEDEDEELGHAETYAEYMPPKLKIGNRHPDPVVETSSLSSVEPPDIWYRLSIPESIIDYGQLSAVQLETITYTSQKHDQFLPNGERAGFLVGDGAGVGKGRTIAGIIYENYLQGRKRSLWLSVSNDLRVDAERDLRDIGAGKIEVHPLNKFKYAKISSHINGSVKKGVVFATYSSLIGESTSSESKYRTRFKQLVHWLGKDFDGCIVFDECHRAKNLCPVGSSKPTKTGTTVLELQNKLKKARIVYASATGASEPRNMAYMTRLGLWGKGTPFREFSDFINAVEKRGVGAMELVAMDMKLRGQYIARQLSFQGVSFKIEEIPVPKEFYRVYNESVKLWVDAREAFQIAADLLEAEHRMRKSMWGQFWSAHQRFFKYLCISAKVPHCVRVAREAVKNGKCVVIGLQSTGEARTLETLEESGGVLDDFVSTVKGVFQTLVEKHFPAPDRKKTSDWFASSIWDDSPVPSPSGATKRKKKVRFDSSKRAKMGHEEDWSSSSSDSDDNKKKKSDSSADSSSSSESELSLSESDESSDDPDDNFNPFGNGSDSDDDPWLKKSKAKKSKEKKKKVPKAKKKKEKKLKKKKKKKEKQNSKDEEKNDADSDDEIDKQFDNYLKNSTINAAIGGNTKAGGFNSTEAVEKAVIMKADLLRKLERIGDRLPSNTLDELIDSLGGTENVAEMTGRKGRVVSTDDGGVQYESRSESDVPLEILNLTEKQRFMDGEKNIAIISEAASSGISLQADRRALNQRRRVHITLELPWSADRAIQQFGRTHRSNQVSAPEYMFMISELAGERRFAATVAKRLESLGALTHGDRRATESRDLSRFNIDNKYGRAALEAVMKSVLRHEAPVTAPPKYEGNFFDAVRDSLVGVGMVSWDERAMYASLEKDYNNMSKFLNRILGIEVELQNLLFKYFQDTLKAIILQAKRNGRWDMGILDLGSGGEEVKLLETQKFTSNFSGTNVKTQLHTVRVERGLSWNDAMSKWHDHSGPDDGFYISAQIKNNKKTAVLAVAMGGKKNKEKLFRVYRPNTGLQLRAETLEEIRQKYRKVLPDTAQAYWDDQYYASVETCSHAYWKGNCRRAYIGRPCEVGLRCRTYYVLSGSVLGCWTKVEAVLASLPGGHATRMQIIRLKTDDGMRIVGSLIPEQALKPLTTLLKSQVPLEEHRPIQHIASAPVFNNLNMRNSPSPTFGGSPMLMPHTNSVSSFRTITSGGSTLQQQPSGLSGAASFRITQPVQHAVTPKFRMAPAKPKTPAMGIQAHTVAVQPPVHAKPSFTVMESPEDEFRDMPSFL